ncbi:hypothetical protein D3Z51_16905 [Clostridiaceae bacterium]|nr:hypothetical protein [Clostridiaceae bacterium]RKI09066.1 hypothetical protein D7V81_18085 [bacterium 1XD21-70]
MGARIFAQIGKIIHDFILDFKQFFKLIFKRGGAAEGGEGTAGRAKGSQGRQEGEPGTARYGWGAVSGFKEF